jgi:HD-like signal output (HDOD) protein
MFAGAQLAALPQSAIRLLELTRDPQAGPAEIAVPIEADPGLLGQVLRFVNSSYFGFSRKISSVKLAIALVGIRTVKNFALWNAVFRLIPNPKCGPFDLKDLWRDSLRRALFARTLGRLEALANAEDLFTAALLQDMAIPVLAHEAPEVYLKLLEARRNGRRRLSTIERQLFGWTHAEAAGILARHWKLPEHTAVLIEGHCQMDCLSDAPAAKSDEWVVALSAMLPSIADPLWVDCQLLEEQYARTAPASTTPLADLLEQVDREFRDFAPVMKVGVPGKSLTDFYQEAMATA